MPFTEEAFVRKVLRADLVFRSHPLRMPKVLCKHLMGLVRRKAKVYGWKLFPVTNWIFALIHLVVDAMCPSNKRSMTAALSGALAVGALRKALSIRSRSAKLCRPVSSTLGLIVSGMKN